MLGSYVLGPSIAAGGSSTLHLACVLGPEGFRRTVVAKRLRKELIADPVARELLLFEAQVASKIHQANVVAVLDLLDVDGEVLLVCEYVHGVSLATLLRASGPVPLPIAAAVVRDVLDGLHAAHSTVVAGRPLGVVHRDVSPDNILVGSDGTTRVVDFGIARALGRPLLTSTGEVRGKIAYASPEHVNGDDVDARSDVYSAGVVLWEVLAGRRLFDARPGPDLLEQVGIGLADPVRAHRPEVPKELCALTLQALAWSPAERPPSAEAMARAIERASLTATPAEVAAWVSEVAGASLADNERKLRAFEQAAAELAIGATSTERSTGPAPLAGRASARSKSTAPTPEGNDARKRSMPENLGRATKRIRVAAAVTLSAACLFVHAVASPTGPAPALVTSKPRSAASSDGLLVYAVASDERPAAAAPVEEPVPPSSPKSTTRALGLKRRYAVATDCERPYALDQNGHKTYKRACLGR